LALSATTFTVGTPSSGTITGATVGSTITASGLPTGLTINGVARTWAWDGTGTAGSGSFTLTETLLGAVGSPKTTTINYTVNAGAGTLSAPTIGFPSPIAANPATILIHVPVDWQSGDVLKLARSSSSAMSSPTFLTHTLTDADITAGTFSIGLSGVTLSGITYFQALGSHSGVDSANLSNIVAWGDTTAPVITTSATTSVYEQVPLAVTLAATDTGGVPALLSDGTSSGWYISGGADRLQFQIVLVAGVPTLQWYNNGTQTFNSPQNNPNNSAAPYNVIVTAVDYGGNQTAKAIAVTVNAITASISPAFSNVNNAPLSTVETSNTVTVTVAPVGLSVSASVTGTGFTYSKNGGAFQPAGSFTVQNGDTIALRVTSGASNSIVETGNLSIGLGIATASWSVSTPTPIQNTTTNGVNKSHDVNATAFQVVCNSAAGAVIATRSTGPQNHVGWYVEATINGFASLVLLAVDDGTVDLDNGGTGYYPGNTKVPGSGCNGFTVYTQSGSTTVNVVANGATTNFTLPSSRTAAVGDTIGVAFNSSTNVLSVYYFSSGFGDLGLLGTITLTSLIPSSVFIIQGGFSGTGTVATSDTITTNYGGSGYVRTPPGGSTTFA
jgi:hypothetical protein